MWKKAMLPLLLLLLLLTALLLAQLVAATESTQLPVNAKDISTSNSSTERSIETTLDINDKDDDAHDDADEATVETYEETADDDEESSVVTKKAIPQLMKTTPPSEDADAGVSVGEGKGDAGDDVGSVEDEGDVDDDGETTTPDEGSGGGGGGGGGDDGDDEAGGEDVSGGGDSDATTVAGVGDEGDETTELLPPLKLRGRDRLAVIMMREVTQLIDYALEQQRSVVNQFLQDDTIEMVKCATMEAVKKSCASFIAGVRDALKMNKGDDFATQFIRFGVKTLMARNFEAFVDQHNTTRIKQPTAENVIIDNALKKAGVLQIELEMQQRFVEFSKMFNTTVGEYVDRLLPSERKLDETLVVWYGEFNAATNVSSQVSALAKFLPLYKNIFDIEIESN
ncbi:PREDICTED: uncharacterized protein LOC108376964 [Rhagoletis zephyria]|uniref:uncharacterized protein LOC108376964 n=1 Tax=Rhagoletis zephyria TaxID=28612 RepID=UPI0008112444|nr:PREDICTED: uncharacterized protein LOC108376964 [Rhagoletis zephyria]XP_017488715.1 PREDICTED: uncharacterized protein LOC108376964 [Rhagoletis zephyria]